MLAKPATRWGAFGIHLAISALVFVALAAIIVYYWYPGFLFRTDGGWQGIRLVAGIDVVLGPLLTLIVYDRAKKSLRKDLAVIACIQAGALAAGCYLVYQERPIAVVFADNKFSTLSKNSFAFHGIDPAGIELIRSNRKPVWIYAETRPLMPGETVIANFQRLGPAHLRTENYQPFAENLDRIARLGQARLENHPGFQEADRKRYYRMISRYYEGYLLFDLGEQRVTRAILTNRTAEYDVRAG